jgi:hypothetical protein
MTPKEKSPEEEDKSTQLLEEICEHTMAIRRVTNRILDHLHETHENDDDYDPDTVGWDDLYDNDDMYY